MNTEKQNQEPKDGVCCACGYSGVEETDCLKRIDGIHCVHWWEGENEEQGTDSV